MTLRDEFAAVLGPGNNDQIAYEQADTVLEILSRLPAVTIVMDIAVAMQDAEYGPYPRVFKRHQSH